MIVITVKISNQKKRVFKIGIVELAESILKRLEKRGVKYSDSLYVDMKTLKASLDGMGMQFNNRGKNG